MENWKPIQGFEGVYDVSDLGRIRSYKNYNHGLKKEPTVLRLSLNNSGYPHVGLLFEGKRLQKTVHRLVAEAFLPNPHGHAEIDHKNGNKTDNRVENLEWVSRTENQVRAWQSGLKVPLKRERNPASKLTVAKAKEIKELYATGKYTTRQLGEMYGVSKTAVGFVLRGETWNEDRRSENG